MFVLISYDIEDDKLRTRLAKVLEGHGQRVQYSVFECHLRDGEFRALLALLTGLYDEMKSAAPSLGFSVRCYRLCAACADRIEIIGDGEVSTDPGYYLV